MPSATQSTARSRFSRITVRPAERGSVATPFHRAAHARMLRPGATAGFRDRDHGIEELARGSWHALKIADGIDTPVILQLERGVKAEEVGCANCIVGARHVLHLVD